MVAHQHHGAERVVASTLPRASAAMNITPMIDVLLVLLVIFMVTTLFVMAAGSLRYGEIVHVIDAAKGAGVTRVGIVTESMRGINR